MKYIYFFLLLLPFISSAEELEINNVKVRQNTFYLSISNLGDETDYLLRVEVDNSSGAIYKTIIDKGMARIIKIDRLIIPPRSMVDLAPLGIYIVINNLSALTKPVKLKLVFSKTIRVIQL
jgi:copper(I)-binding protein